jgi:hypothetical protein
MNDSLDNRRAHPRLSHPIDAQRLGLVETPLQIYDLSVGGCFINDFHHPPVPGKSFDMRLELPDGETVTIRGEVVHGRTGYGYAVRFLEVSDAARARLERALEYVKNLHQGR